MAPGRKDGCRAAQAYSFWFYEIQFRKERCFSCSSGCTSLPAKPPLGRGTCLVKGREAVSAHPRQVQTMVKVLPDVESVLLTGLSEEHLALALLSSK